MVGPSGSGKTMAWRVLLKALERLEGVEGVAHIIDPKAISKDHLYGTLDPNTREWTDGLFTHILRKWATTPSESQPQTTVCRKTQMRSFSFNFRIIDNVRGELQKRQWIIFDGDVDPEWVENLNSVLDDNKLLTLPNGERLSLPPNVRALMVTCSTQTHLPLLQNERWVRRKAWELMPGTNGKIVNLFLKLDGRHSDIS